MNYFAILGILILYAIHVTYACRLVHFFPMPQDGDKNEKKYQSQMVEVLAYVLNNEDRIKIASNYLSYGCYCGPGGAGATMDETDKCCMNHDNCYSNNLDTSSSLAMYSLTYSYMVNQTKDGHEVICVGSPENTKSQSKCNCDKTLAGCLRDALPSYDPDKIGQKEKKMCVKGRIVCSDLPCSEDAIEK